MTDGVARSPRHPSVEEKMGWLEPNPNLPPHLHVVASEICGLAERLLGMIPEDHPQLSLALQHLIDAKDCAVRAKLAEV